MKPTNHKKPAKKAAPAPKGKRGGYRMPRNADGLTPKQRLDTAKAEAQEFENRRKREEWQTRADAEQAARETAEIIQSDLYGTIPLALAGKLSGRAFTPGEVRAIVRMEIDSAVRNWVKGGRVPPESIVPLETAPQ